MSIAPIGAVSAVGTPLPPMPVSPVADPSVAGAAGASASPAAVSAAGADASATGASFAQSLAGVVDNLQGVQATADRLAVQAVTGQLDNPQDYLIAATESSLATQMTVAVRNKALESFNEIMRMPL